MKKILSFTLILVIVLGISACSENNKSKQIETIVENSEAELNVSLDIEDEKMYTMFSEAREFLDINYLPNVPISREDFFENIELNDDYVDVFYGEESTAEEFPDKLIIIKAKEGYVDNIKVSLEKYRDELIKSVEYPEQIPIYDGVVIDSADNYVYFICLAGNLSSIENSEEITSITLDIGSKIKNILDNIIIA